MQYSLILLVALMMTCLACSTAYPSYIVDVDNHFTPVELEKIESSLNEWETYTGSRVRFYVRVSDYTPPLEPDAFYIHRATELQCPGRTMQPNWGGLTYPGLGGQVICVNSDVHGGRYFRRIIMHEVGHALGLDHLENGTVMGTPAQNCSDHLTQSDLNAFCDVSGLCD